METLELWHRAGRYETWREYRIFVRTTEASGRPTLLLIHGFPTASWDWTKIWEPLATRFRLVTLDMLGFGFSDKPADFVYSLMSQADLFVDILQRMGIKNAHLLAHDYGDSVAQELLARHSDGSLGLRLKSVVLLNGGLFPESHRPVLMQLLLKGPAGPLIARLASRATLANSMRRIFAPQTPPTEEEIDGFWALMAVNDGHARMPKLLRYLDERRQYRDRWVDALRRPGIPVRFINGLLDPISGAHMAARYRELVADPDIVALPQTGHYPQLENPVAVLAAIQDFHDRIGTSR